MRNIVSDSTSRINLEESTSSITFKEYSSIKEDEVCLKTSHKEDDYQVTNFSYTQLFKLSIKLIYENDKIKNHNLDLKDYLEFLEKSNEMLKFEISNIRNLA